MLKPCIAMPIGTGIVHVVIRGDPREAGRTLPQGAKAAAPHAGGGGSAGAELGSGAGSGFARKVYAA